GEVWRATRTPLGAATLHLWPTAGALEAEAWRPGAACALDGAAALAGRPDADAGFRPAAGLAAAPRPRLPRLRPPRTGAPREEAGSMPAEKARERLRAVAGVGVWTANSVALNALGDADALPLGDWNLPHTVSYVLTGEPRGSDARMLELLAPYPGHRGRVLRL